MVAERAKALPQIQVEAHRKSQVQIPTRDTFIQAAQKTHAVTSLQLQIPPCMGQVAGHPRMQTWPAKLRAT